MRNCFMMAFLLFTSLAFASVSAHGAEAPLNYKDIHGVTQEEIDSIEALKARGRSFSYAGSLSSETFAGKDQQIMGFTAHLCRLLSQLFQTRFVPAVYDWEEMVNGMANKTIDFSGDFTRTPERSMVYLMSKPIAERSIAAFYLAGSAPVRKIAEYRTPVLGFISGAINRAQLAEVYEGPFESVYLKNLADVPAALETRKIDAFITENVLRPSFESDTDIVSDVWTPLIYSSVSLTTKNPELWAIISVFDKFIDNGGRAALSAQYAQGMADHAHFELHKKFTKEEHDFIASHLAAGKKVPVLLESGNYPICFYNETAKEFQGIVPDLLKQMTTLTGLEFECVNTPEEDWSTVLAKLQSGKAALVSELLYTPSRKDHFLWPAKPYCVTRYALLSRRDVPNQAIYQTLGKRIGAEHGTAYFDVANKWFPHVEVIPYLSIDDAFAALDRDEIDLIMASENMLLSQTNYSEKPAYKASLTLDYPVESKLGFHKDQQVLLSIFDKAHSFTHGEDIVRSWTSRVYDYTSKLAQSRVQLLLVSILLLAALITLLMVFLLKSRRHRSDLASLVRARTGQLEEKTATLSTIYNAIPDWLFCKDTQGRFTSCNPSFEAYIGLPKEDIVGKSTSELGSHIDPLVIELDDAQEQDLIASNLTITVEHLVTYPNGEQKMQETVKTPLRQNDVVVGVVGISRDITAHKAAQEAAQAASRAKSSFLARMSHEMRTPLNAIIGMAEIARASIDNSVKTLSSVNQIIVSSRHLLRLINDVLDMSKIESGHLEILEQPFSLQKALAETLTIVSPRCAEKGLVFESNVAQLPDMTLVGDKLRLVQVLINLLSNASKFTEAPGRVELAVDIVHESADQALIHFAVKDSGIGLSDEQKARLFKPFEQADSSIASRFGGTGLGLSISCNLVKGMGGSIAIASAEGKGAEFSFELLFKKSDLLHDSVQEYAAARPLELSGSRILLVEDIEVNSMIVKELLSPTGVAIDVAINGREAVDLFEQSKPGHYQLIFMDIQMPVMDGYEASALIRALPFPHARDIPIIAMTANAYKEDVARSFANGMNGHLGKPIDVAELMKCLATHLPGRSPSE